MKKRVTFDNDYQLHTLLILKPSAMIDFIVNKKMSFSLFAIVFLLFASCKKEEIKPIEEAKENKTFVTKYFENPTGNKDDKALQLIISNIQDKYSIRVYGTFNDNN